MVYLSVAVDGPAGAGKSSVSKAVAAKFGFIYVDTGAMYRAVALKSIQLGLFENSDIISMLDNTTVDIRYCGGVQHVFLDGSDVNDKIRTEEVSAAASRVSAIPEVRLKLVQLQRQLAADNNVIMDGRDIGTYVLPDAKLKIFLTASSDERAKRRCLEYDEKGIAYDFGEVKKEIETRDYNDSHRSFAPLCRAEDAVLVITDGIPFDEVVEKLSMLVKEKL